MLAVMRIAPTLLAALTLVTLGSCARSVPPPRVAPRPVPLPVPPPAPTPTAGADWRDWPATPGDWRYAQNGAATEATFGLPGAPLFIVACSADRRVRLTRVGAAPGAMTIRTSTMLRTLAGPVESVAASDPLLDAMGYSRGRFVVQNAAGAALVVPAWAELLRVIEDCDG